MTSSVTKHEGYPICGFESAYYGNGQSIIFTMDNFVKYTAMVNGRPEMKNRHLGRISSSFVTNDHSILLVATEEEGNAKVIGLNTDTFEEIFALSVRDRVTTVAASSGSEVRSIRISNKNLGCCLFVVFR